MDMNDFRLAVSNYPRDSVVLEILNFQEPGSVINPGELCNFRVRIRNQGQVDMKSVRLHLQGIGGVKVASSFSMFGTAFPGAFGQFATTNAMDVDAHVSKNSELLFMIADKATSAATRLFTAHIFAWDASLDHILKDHTAHTSPPQADFTERVFPS